MSERKYSFLKCTSNKPSDFFKFIKEGLLYAYVSKDEGKNLKSVPKPKNESVSKEKSQFPAIESNQSKTIDTSNLPPVDKQR